MGDVDGKRRVRNRANGTARLASGILHRGRIWRICRCRGYVAADVPISAVTLAKPRTMMQRSQVSYVQCFQLPGEETPSVYTRVQAFHNC